MRHFQCLKMNQRKDVKVIRILWHITYDFYIISVEFRDFTLTKNDLAPGSDREGAHWNPLGASRISTDPTLWNTKKKQNRLTKQWRSNAAGSPAGTVIWKRHAINPNIFENWDYICTEFDSQWMGVFCMVFCE